METPQYILEACVDSLEAALAAEAAGADRIELCSALELGGITPSIGLIELVCERLSIPVQVLLRPRPGNFVYSPEEVETLCTDARLITQSGAAGIVTGALDSEGDLAIEEMKRLIDASGLPLTFHRAFDHGRNPLEITEQLIALGVERILTSGQQASALAGITLLQELQERFGKKIVFMPGGGISAENISSIASMSGCREFHFSALRTVASPTNGPGVGNGISENVHFIPNPGKVVAIRRAIGAPTA